MPEHYAEMMYRGQMNVVRYTMEDLVEWKRWWGDENVRCPLIVFKSGKDDPLVPAAFFHFGVAEEFQLVGPRSLRCAN